MLPVQNPNTLFLTFLLAIIGYAGLTVTVVLISCQKYKPVLWHLVSLIIFIHVIMVWSFRYDWNFSLAIRNGYIGFLLFHSALTMILFANFLSQKISQTLIQISFLIVTAGALGATFIYDIVAIYRIPVILCAIIGIGFVIQFYVAKLRAK